VAGLPRNPGALFSLSARQNSRASNERNPKHQRASIWLRGSSFYIRYYATTDGKSTEFLCECDDKLTIAEFWDGTQLPVAERNPRAFYSAFVLRVVEHHAKPHFGDPLLATSCVSIRSS